MLQVVQVLSVMQGLQGLQMGFADDAGDAGDAGIAMDNRAKKRQCTAGQRRGHATQSKEEAITWRGTGSWTAYILFVECMSMEEGKQPSECVSCVGR